MNILLLGSSGFLGQEIYKSLKKTRGILLYHNGLKKRHFDLTKIANLKKLIIKSKADLIKMNSEIPEKGLEKTKNQIDNELIKIFGRKGPVTNKGIRQAQSILIKFKNL
jgi:nucleoside-diphosphate-sugar epimerase